MTTSEERLTHLVQAIKYVFECLGPVVPAIDMSKSARVYLVTEGRLRSERTVFGCLLQNCLCFRGLAHSKSMRTRQTYRWTPWPL